MEMRKRGLTLALEENIEKKPASDSNLTKHSAINSCINKVEKHSPGRHAFTLMNDYFQ